jgi:hypothetical protein
MIASVTNEEKGRYSGHHTFETSLLYIGLASRIQFGFPQGTRTEGDDFTTRNNYYLACARITSLTRLFHANRKPAEASDDDRFSSLKRRHEQS